MPKHKICSRDGCRKRLPNNRTKYCSNKCMIQVIYVDQRLACSTNKTCLYAGCSKTFTGTKRQKYCSVECRLRHHRGIALTTSKLITDAPHPCLCCEPSKMIVGPGSYCPENAWMRTIPKVEVETQLDKMEKLNADKMGKELLG